MCSVTCQCLSSQACPSVQSLGCAQCHAGLSSGLLQSRAALCELTAFYSSGCFCKLSRFGTTLSIKLSDEVKVGDRTIIVHVIVAE